MRYLASVLVEPVAESSICVRRKPVATLLVSVLREPAALLLACALTEPVAESLTSVRRKPLMILPAFALREPVAFLLACTLTEPVVESLTSMRWKPVAAVLCPRSAVLDVPGILQLVLGWIGVLRLVRLLSGLLSFRELSYYLLLSIRFFLLKAPFLQTFLYLRHF